MNIADAKEQIKDSVEAYLLKDDAGMYKITPARQRPIFLIGAPGIGKTAIMEQIAQELQIGIVSYSMTHHTRQSALGLPRIVHNEFEGFEYDSSEYTMSEIVSSIYDYMSETGLRAGILFLDEINCVSETLYPSMLQFLQFKTFGRHRIPHDWIIVCAGNPPEYNKSVHEFDIVTLDRLREIEVEPEYAAWKRYATQKGIHPAVTTFLEAKPDCFYLVQSKPGGGKSFVTARGWEDLAEAIALYEEMGKPISRDLIGQFLRDDDIADSFSVYYNLFDKYRSDYQIMSILLAVCLLTGIVGCRKKEQKADAKYTIYQINQSGTALVPKDYDGTGKSVDEEVKGMLSALQKCDDEVKAQAALPKKVKLERYTLEDEKLILYYNAAYGKMDTVREVLCRAALVRSLTQIDGVDLVMICVDGTPLTDKKGNTYGYQQAEDFVQNTGSSINSFQEMKLTLYYADSSGEKLQKEEDTVRYNSNESKERVVVEQLMRGPSNNRLLATIPKGTKLLGVSIKDHICYLNFDEGLRNIAPGVSPETVIYSIVNSVIDGGNVSEVQISINGDSSIVYQESIKLDEPLSRNQEMIKED